MKKLIIVALSLIVIFACLGWQVQAKTQSAVPGFAASIKAINSDTAPGGMGFIKFAGIDGECQEINHQKWSYLESFDQLIQAPGSPAGGGIRTGRVSLEDIVVDKPLDKSSPKLAEAAIKGTTFPTVNIQVGFPAETGAKIFYAYELKNVQITKYWVRGGVNVTPVDTGMKLGAADISLGAPMDELALSFSEIKVTYTEYDNLGNNKGVVEYSWNVRTGR
jgi:type VI secretion system Hcp family effector